MRVAIADDSVPLRNALHAMLGRVGAAVVISVGSGEELVAALRSTEVDVAIIDMRMPPSNTNEGLLTARAVTERYPGTKVLIISADDEAPYASELFSATSSGVGYVTKRNLVDPGGLRDVLARLGAGRPVVDADAAARLLSDPALSARLAPLDASERDAIPLVLQDRSSASVADILGISRDAAKALVEGALAKIGVSVDGGTCEAVLAWIAHRP